MQRLSLLETPLTGMNLIEASAGTGKTYTITGLYIRLVVERELTVDQILVVTYTKAATAELRERIRSRMVELKRAYANGSEDSLCDALFVQHADVEQRLKRLNLAILSFDQAAVFTIHGFCQRLLAQSAFESGMPFQTEMLLDERPLIQEIIDDFWHRRIEAIQPGLQRYLLNNGFSPDRLAAGVRGMYNKPYMSVRGVAMPAELAQLEARFNERFARMREVWLTSRCDVTQLLKESDGLSRSKYRIASIDKWVPQMDLFLQAHPGQRFKELEKFSTSTLATALKKSGVAPSHIFFDLCEQLLQLLNPLEELYEQARVALFEEMLCYLNEELHLRKQQQRVQSYDDLLLNLDRALQGDRAEQLIAAVRSTYSAALIDEFQDTDPIQYESFRRLFRFEGCSLFLVGDPKQAIYSFRGADIFAYLKARQDAGNCYTLDVNWRSVPSLIHAVNTLFEQATNSFLFPQIPFHPSLPAERLPLCLKTGDSDTASFNIGFIPGETTKEQATLLAANWAADEIQQLIRSGCQGDATLGGRPLTGGDIAVLVRSHRQGETIRQALTERGIYSVQRSQQDVFKSHEAIEIERIMLAVQEAQNEGLVFAALATSMLGISGETIAGLADDEVELSGYLERFHDYHQMWLQDGFMRMFRHLLHEQQVVERVLQLPEGERRLTNILHLAQLLHQQERATTAGMEALCSWLSQLRLGEWPEDESSQLRLESDDNLVQIVTIHKSKGLQYPVVFAPFVWDGGVRQVKAGEPCSFHDPAQGYSAVLDLGSSAWTEASEGARDEALAESLRLLYVALTRAQQRCYITWGQVNGAEHSPLAWLLHPPAGSELANPAAQLAEHFKTLSEADLLHRLRQWIEPLEGYARIENVSDRETTLSSSETAPAASQQSLDFDSLKARLFNRKLNRGRSVTSFSALAAGHDNFERPDHDAVLEPLSDEPETRPILNGFNFPRGANPGSCLHAIFENLDFTRHTKEELELLVEQQLALFAIDPVWRDVVCQMITDVLATELEPNSGLSLGQLGRSQCLVEMEFNYPVADLKAAELSALVIQKGLIDNQTMIEAIKRLGFRDIQGYMKGFIDLIFEFNGRYYLLDYKSNWLGNKQSDYDHTNLNAAIAREGYFLQYLLYSVALHRYLAGRIKGYDYDAHFGSVFYLFLRGMSPATGPAYGVYRDRPSRQLIESLDEYFASAEAVV
ncbi:MAG: exodeoxyribonuclease V subunit beta [Sedimenticola thiotaurini]|uniref:RecBCD enzyme subunit RecB n=1 Tax=Sedimenticola thiotaurini TaxID=1543721 RepID=A0A558CUK6_9GAMM|nr:MAG: exodeoxyribonuclease V subunit beta [Sedimenticola thiotaurini]